MAKNEFKVIQPFMATAPISGAERQFRPNEVVVCDPKQNGPTLTIQVGGTFFLVDRAVFEASCQRM